MADFLGKLEVVEIQDTERSLEITLFYDEKGEVRTVKFNKQSYDEATRKWSPDEDRLKKYEENCREILGVEPENVVDIIGNKYDVWETDSYCALWEPKTLEKFPADWVGQILTAEIKEVNEFPAKGQFVLTFEGKDYGSNINWGNYIAAKKQSFPDPQKKHKQLDKFKQKFNTDWEDRESLIGKDVMIEVKKNNMDATGKNPTYIEVKAFPKR